MPSLPKRLYPIQVAIAEMLSRVEHYGKLYSLDDMATILNLATNTRDKTISFDLQKVFAHKEGYVQID